jgi:hypothetical protein
MFTFDYRNDTLLCTGLLEVSFTQNFGGLQYVSESPKARKCSRRYGLVREPSSV